MKPGRCLIGRHAGTSNRAVEAPRRWSSNNTPAIDRLRGDAADYSVDVEMRRCRPVVGVGERPTRPTPTPTPTPNENRSAVDAVPAAPPRRPLRFSYRSVPRLFYVFFFITIIDLGCPLFMKEKKRIEESIPLVEKLIKKSCFTLMPQRKQRKGSLL